MNCNKCDIMCMSNSNPKFHPEDEDSYNYRMRYGKR